MMIFSLILIVFLLFLIIYNGSLLYSVFKGAPYVSSQKVSRDKVADLIPDGAESIAELGSGLGNLVKVFLADQNIKKVYSVDVNPVMVFLQKIRFRKDYRSGRLILMKADLMRGSLPQAEVYYMYLLPRLLQKVLERLAEIMPENSLIISNGFKSDKFEHAKELKFENAHFFLYTRKELIPYE